MMKRLFLLEHQIHPDKKTDNLSSTATAMTQTKKIHLLNLRADSAYATFRFIVNFIAFITCIGAGLSIIWGVFAFSNPYAIDKAIVAFVGGFVTLILGLLSKGASLILADIADSIIDSNIRSEERKQ
jgi:hypothetical protein